MDVQDEACTELVGPPATGGGHTVVICKVGELAWDDSVVCALYLNGK